MPVMIPTPDKLFADHYTQIAAITMDRPDVALATTCIVMDSLDIVKHAMDTLGHGAGHDDRSRWTRWQPYEPRAHYSHYSLNLIEPVGHWTRGQNRRFEPLLSWAN